MSELKQQRQPRVKMSGLWADATKDGIKYLSGTTGGQKWSIWPNSFKTEGDNAPTHILYIENLAPKEEPKAAKPDAF
jgi:hypothetical protein